SELVIRFGYGRILPSMRRLADADVAAAGPAAIALPAPGPSPPAPHSPGTEPPRAQRRGLDVRRPTGRAEAAYAGLVSVSHSTAGCDRVGRGTAGNGAFLDGQ